MTFISENNSAFYENIPPESFQNYSEIIGMDACRDVEIVYAQVKKVAHILELGSGYGRVLSYLLAQGFAGKITAVERSKSYTDFLNRKFSAKVNVIRQDIRTLELDFKVDAILWMWSGITELNPQESQVALTRCCELLNAGGLMFIEAPYRTIHLVGTMGEQKRVRLDTDFGVLRAYLAGEEEIRQFAKRAGFQNPALTIYKTPKNIERVIYTLKK